MTLQAIFNKVNVLRNVQSNDELLVSLLREAIFAAGKKAPLIRRLKTIERNDAQFLLDSRKANKHWDLFHDCQISIIAELKPYLA